jgi:hypothetical protein
MSRKREDRYLNREKWKRKCRERKRIKKKKGDIKRNEEREREK